MRFASELRNRDSTCRHGSLFSSSVGLVVQPAKAPCAMVPLKPNELRRDVHRAWLLLETSPVRATASTGIRNDDRVDDTIDDRWAFNLRARNGRRRK